ncbi:unnamed protein product, partial [marine sediment metagenome]
RNNPIMKRMLKARYSQIVGTGATIEIHEQEKDYPIEKDELQKIVDRFWNQPRNGLGTNLYDLSVDLAVNGTIFLPAFVTEKTGDIMLALMPPWRMADIITE